MIDPRLYNGHTFAPDFGMPTPGMPTNLPIVLQPPSPIDPLRTGGVGMVHIRPEHLRVPTGGYRELPRYGVGTVRTGDLGQNNLMMPTAGVRQMGRHTTRDDTVRAMQKMMREQFQAQFFNRLMLGRG